MKKAFILFFLFVFMLGIYFLMAISPALYSGDEKIKNNREVVLTGHRGAAGLAPENTMAAVIKALDSKVDRIEIDVQQTKDHKIICLHDERIDRTTDGTGLVKDLNYKNILKFSAGVKFSENYLNEKIPKLNQVMELIDGKATLLIEIKKGNDYYPGIEKRVIDAINKHDAKSWTIIHSFNDKVLEKVREIDKSIEVHKLFIADFPFVPLIFDVKLRITNLAQYEYVTEFSTLYTFTTKRLVNEVHAMGKKINVWTVNDSLKINRLLNMGVDGIITDYPDYFGR